ncbi:conserved hypothetical protein [Ricinus communis]|uniref:Retrotransposon gag domain-containing protein n=1 Tax=Ricinus communis TaxID=3988 RepID=B9RQ17_RICCO|nr:conserved hypothetical protein [Ricinus communis]
MTLDDTYFEKYVALQEKNYVFRFLNGLNKSYQGLRSQVILLKPFPSLDQAYNMVLREESHRSMHLQSTNFTDVAAMAVKRSRQDVKCLKCGKMEN